MPNNTVLSAVQPVLQLEKRKGGYFYITVDAETVDKLPAKKKTRLICRLDDKVLLRCGLNHMGDGFLSSYPAGT